MSGRVFPEVENSNKKEARTDAADQALRILMAEGQLQSAETPSMVRSHVTDKNTNLYKHPQW